MGNVGESKVGERHIIKLECPLVTNFKSLKLKRIHY